MNWQSAGLLDAQGWGRAWAHSYSHPTPLPQPPRPPEGPPSLPQLPLNLATGLRPTPCLFFLQEISQLIDRSKSFHSRHQGDSDFWTPFSTCPLLDQIYNVISMRTSCSPDGRVEWSQGQALPSGKSYTSGV